MSHQHSTSQDPGMEAYQAGGLPYNANEHGGLEPNPLADGGSAPEVVAAPVDYYASPEKDASGQYPPQQYHQQPTQWAHEPMLPKYPGTPADPGYGVDHSNQAGAYDYATPAQYQGDDAYHPPIPAGAPVAEEEKPGPRWCGMPRKRAMILMIVAVLIVIAVAVGVGVGVGDKKSSSPSTVATPTSSTPASSSSSPTSTAGPVNTEVPCPQADNTTVTASGNKKFVRYCGIDFASGNGEGNNINSVKTTSMTDCINACAAFPGCGGVGWGFITGDTGNLYSCFMKDELNHSHAAVSTWNFAVLQPSNLTFADLNPAGKGNVTS